MARHYIRPEQLIKITERRVHYQGVSMKALTLAAVLLFACPKPNASTCIVQEASPEAMMSYRNRIEASIELNEKDVEVLLVLPSEVGTHALHAVSLVIENENRDRHELFVPIATIEDADGNPNKVYLVLTKWLFERAALVVNYGRCALQYQLDLQSIESTTRVPANPACNSLRQSGPRGETGCTSERR
ncbi:MAG: hypothetical protein RLO46_08670 [Pseudomonadales bacterium]